MMQTCVSVIALMAANMLALQSAQAQSEAAAPASGEEVVMDAIIVSGQRASISRAIELERSSDTLITAITADDIGNFADQNVAESLQRAAGVTIVRDEGEGRFIRVRGLSDDFNQVLLNGAQLGSSDPGGGRSVALDVVSSELLRGITVAKALTPDLDHDSLGALVELRTLSAFDRPQNSLRLRAEGSHNQRSGLWSPKFGADLTWRSKDDRFGVALAFNYFDRELELDNLRNDVGPPFSAIFRTPTNTILVDPAPTAIPAGSTRFLRPQEVDQRVEIGNRKRVGGTVGLDFRPTDNAKYYLNFIAARLEDSDVRVQQEIELRRASRPQDIAEINERGGLFTRVDFEKQVFFQDRTDRIFAANFGGENKFSDWTLSYRFDYSHNQFTLPEGLRGRFRERDTTFNFTFDRDTATLELRPSPNPALIDGNVPANFTYDSILQIDERRTDEIMSYGWDLQRDFEFFGQEAFVKFGVENRNRDKVIRRGELTLDPSSTANRAILLANNLPTNLAGFDLFTPSNTRLSSITFFPNLGQARDVFEQTTRLLNIDTSNSGREDFDNSEDVLAGYAMFDMNPIDSLTVIGGIRVERTRYASSGTRVERIELDGTQVGQTSSALQRVDNNYTRLLPSIHFRWDPRDDLLVRLSLTRNLVRPQFGDASALQSIETQQETVAGVVQTISRTLEGGNPNLRPLTANGVDLSLGWYPLKDTAFTVAGFYKDLNNPFVSATFTGPDVALANLPVFDPVTGEGFSEVDTTGNAGSGRLLGVEFSLSHFATWLPKPFDGFYTTGNLTLIDGRVTSEQIRGGESFALPRQPNIVGNITVGYENKRFSIRWSGNYIGDSLNDVDAGSDERDTFVASYFAMDVNLRVNITKWAQFYFDAVNLNEARDIRFYRGDVNGPAYERVDDFSRTFQVGITTNFTF